MSRTPPRCALSGRSARRGRVSVVVVLVSGMMLGTLLVHRALSSSKMDGPPRRPDGTDQRSRGPARNVEKLVVCFGYADLEAGVANLHPSQVGRVEEVLVRENDTVAARAVLLRLDDRA